MFAVACGEIAQACADECPIHLTVAARGLALFGGYTFLGKSRRFKASASHCSNTSGVQLHIGVPAQNPRQLATFYHELLGLEVTLEGTLSALGEFIFLSDRPEEETQTLAFMTSPSARHIAWRVESLAALKALYAQAKVHGISINRVLNHRASLSLYLHDPEGNGIEIYWPTGQTVEGLFAEPVDVAQLEQPDSSLLELIYGSNAM